MDLLTVTAPGSEASGLLDRAFSAQPPGAPLPPGPRVNDWARAGAQPSPTGPDQLTRLLDALWAPRGYHCTPDGAPTSIPQRLVPSAGGAYPVQWHVVVPPAAAGQPGTRLRPGRYVRSEDGRLLRRSDEASEPAPDPALTGAAITLAITVQPGRSYGRYRHRAWPLWIADAAYAVEAVRALVPSSFLLNSWSDLEVVRALLSLPAATDSDWWLTRGLAPEVCLARVELPSGWQVDPAALAALGARRSPALAAYAENSRALAHPAPYAREVAAQSGQRWVLGADRVHVWPRPERCAEPAAYAYLWRAHREAAQLTYRLASDGVASRAVSGLTAPPGVGEQPLLHALAVLEPAPRLAGQEAAR